MSAQGLARRSQAAAERLMVDTCRIRPITGNSTDSVTGVVTPNYGLPVYEGKCKIQRFRGTFPSKPDAGEHAWTVTPVEIHVPVVGTSAVSSGDLVEIVSSFDGANVGRQFRITASDRKTFQSAIRLATEEVVE